MAPLGEYQRIMQSIVVRSENNPDEPEFPPDKPKFPATSTKRITVLHFTDVSIKDESTNLTGTHKDRMAWEIVVTYKHILEAILRGEKNTPLPHMSIISSGNAALAIQTMLNRYELPNLHVLVDESIDSAVFDHLSGMGCNLFKANLDEKVLVSEDILERTRNKAGLDITSGKGFQVIGRYYDWFSYEVLNLSPDFIIMPYGTGDLFGNVLTISAAEISKQEHDPRFQGNVAVIRKCNFIGAKTINPIRARHLHAFHLPFEYITSERIAYYKQSALCGDSTGVYVVGEQNLDEALAIAQQHNIKASESGIFGLNYLLENKNRLPKNAKYVIVDTGYSEIDRILSEKR